MTLGMRDLCGRCETAALTPDGSARICSDECSFCGPCASPASRSSSRTSSSEKSERFRIPVVV
ncbi:DUF1272 domain-containing protein [Streptomyces sp. QHH-9511]|uniref:DUF1272 domain-containing protein n=1 Tax=Streptomyces sp. QHH-9511 TaxID=2684468 RepID=UPI0013189563|nr:DUF1272 domain-containing protein [Streptomyces sp. QHH-9511]